MTPTQFEAAGRLLFGDKAWKADAARFLHVTRRNVDYWASPTGYDMPPLVALEIRAELQRRAADQNDDVWSRQLRTMILAKTMRDMLAIGLR